MNKRKLVALGLAISVCLAFLSACGTSKEAKKETPAPAKKVSIATGGTAGTYYPIGAAITAIITKYVPGVEATAESTGASVANLKMIAEKKVDFIMGAANTTLSAFKGEAPFEKPIDNIRGITSLYPETFQFVVLKSSGLQTIYDLKGKRVVVGAPGSGTERTAKLLLTAHGIDYEDIKPQFLSFGEGVTALKDRLVDCAIVGSGIPTSAVVDASATLEINLLSIDPEAFKKIAADNPDLTVVTIPEGTYKGVNKDITTVASPALLTTHKDMDAEMVYQITKAIFSHLDEIKSAHAQGKNVTLDTALKGMSIPLHPGAEKFYKEKGLLK
ncbi:MAG: TAXI family TRAP transporter solute-binding subunit [Peptococcaceae bacterium]|nr:TAXI family TRAP transporter solute-binding subunit [Peptococcaceae bacterium]MDH7523932.1 TAXI family TRAP transporter solute-binding subunit [Peptococcaceae bacterium]